MNSEFKLVLINRIETWEAIVEMYEREGHEPDAGIVAELAAMKNALNSCDRMDVPKEGGAV